MDIEEARGWAAQAWCTKENENKVMDVELAEAFASILVSQMRIRRCGTMGELLAKPWRKGRKDERL